MVYLHFFLKFKSQLRQTRSDIIRQVDESFTRSIANMGGAVTVDKSVISAVFNEEAIGFWLDIYILIEDLKKKIDNPKEFFGFSLVICDNVLNNPDPLCRFLANYNGVFINGNSAKNFVPYAIFEKPSEWLGRTNRRKYGCGNYYRIKKLKRFGNSANNDLELQNEIAGIFETGKNVLVIGYQYSQLHSGLFMFCKKSGNFPPLDICFGSVGLGALVDIWSFEIRSLSGRSGEKPTEEIDKLWELLFRERIRDEVSDYIMRCIKRFLKLVIEFYLDAAKKMNRTPVLALENIHLAERKTAKVLIETLSEIGQKDKENLIILGTGESEIEQNNLSHWGTVFSKIIRIKYKKQTPVYPKLSTELWEILYAVSLLNRYFPPELFLRLCEEDEKNPIMIKRALSILRSLGIIDNLREPRPVTKHLEEHARKALGESSVKIKEFVRGRLLSWAGRRNINPCFRLLTIIDALETQQNGEFDDLLLLKSFLSDIINDTTSGIENSMANGMFEKLVKEKAPAIRCIFYTSKALLSGNEEDIEKTFIDISTEKINEFSSLYLKAQILVNIGAWYLGRHNRNEAAKKIKEAILLGQNRNTFCLAHAYRIFSLVCLSKQQTIEAIEYLQFALSNAEKTDNYNELAISAYYAAATQFLYGDVYNAKKLARKSVEQSLGAGRAEWADRSRFLEGRIEFELGNLKEAFEILQSLRNDPYGNKTDEKDSLLAAWIYRCQIYLNDPNIPKPQPANHDADIFEMEAAFMAGDYGKAFELSNSFNNPFLKENFLYTEQADWRSGFAQCEHLYFTHGEIQDRMKGLFLSLSLSRLPGNRHDEGLQHIQQILRDEKLCEMDPCDAFYFYAKYLILEQTETSPVDKSTAVSIAFKRLQRRASRIDDVETCRQYLNVPRWNRELSLVAKEYKLI
ncbi:MAG: hypothetical protein FWF68_11075 [Spirochaetes bacterium]|nr:hypothetical protein [Spirochaetota bacterium]